MSAETLFDVPQEPTFDREAFHARVKAANEIRTLADARRERDEAMARVDSAADDTWKTAAMETLLRFCQTREPFTTDDVMDDLQRSGYQVREPRALGPVVRRAVTRQWMYRIGYVPSRRRHCSPMPQYRGAL